MVFDFNVFEKAACSEHDRRSLEPMMRTILSFSEKARREGLLALEEVIDEQSDPFIVTGLRLIVDGTSQEYFDELMLTSIASSNLKGKALLSRMVAFSGLRGLMRGDNPLLIKALLEAYVGYSISMPGNQDADEPAEGIQP